MIDQMTSDPGTSRLEELKAKVGYIPRIRRKSFQYSFFALLVFFGAFLLPSGLSTSVADIGRVVLFIVMVLAWTIVIFTDELKPEILKTVGACNAKIIIVTLNDPTATKELVSTLRKTYPNIKIFTRGHSLEECRKLHQLGADAIISENIEASLELARIAMQTVVVEDEENKSIIEDFRRSYHLQIKE